MVTYSDFRFLKGCYYNTSGFFKLTNTLILLCVVIIFSISIIRIDWILTYGGYQYTSGGAGVSVYGVLLVCDGQNPYDNLANDPNGYIFNFLFYLIYGVAIQILADCSTGGIIAVRILTFGIALLSAAIIYLSARQSECERHAALFLALAPISPVVGWWGFSIRPDVAALLFSVLSLGVVDAALRRGSAPLAGLAIACATVAWGFKQPYLVMIPIATILLLTGTNSREVRLAACVSAVLAGILIGSILTHGPTFLHTMVFPSQHHFELKWGIASAVVFLATGGPFIALFGLVLLFALRAGRLPPIHSWLVILSALFIIFSLGAAKFGANSNYYFPVLATMLFVSMKMIPYLSKSRRSSALAVGAVFLIAQNGVLLARGASGNVLEIEPPAIRQELKTLLERHSGQKLVIDSLYALPTHSGSVDVRLLDPYIYLNGVQQVPEAINIDRILRKKIFSVAVIDRQFEQAFDLDDYRLVDRLGRLNVYEPK